MLYKRITAVLLSALIVGSAVSLPASAQSVGTADASSVASSLIGSAKRSLPLTSGDNGQNDPAAASPSGRTHETETTRLVSSGFCSDQNYEDAKWELYESGTLYVYGTGCITNCINVYEPFCSLVIENGITGIRSGGVRKQRSLRASGQDRN